MDRNTEGLQALDRLFRRALSDTGQARRVANFLLAWHNAEENGGWDPVDLWNVDDAIADDYPLRAPSDSRSACLCGGTWLSYANASRLGTVARRTGFGTPT